MKRLLILLVILAGAFLTVVSHAQGIAGSGLQLGAKTVIIKAGVGSFGGETDTAYFSVGTATGFKADTSQTIQLKNVVPFGAGANADTFFYFRASFTALDNDFGSGDTLYVQMDYTNDGTVWVSQGELIPLLRIGATGGGSARFMFRNYVVNKTSGTSYLNMLGNYAIRFRIQHDATNTTANKVRLVFTAFTGAGPGDLF